MPNSWICRRSRALAVGVALAACGLAASLPAQNALPPGAQDPDAQPTATSPPGAARSGGADPAAPVLDPLLARVESDVQQNDYSAARPLLEKYLAGHAGDARALYDLGYLDEVAGKQDAAAADYDKAIAADPRQFESHLALGLILARESKWEQARQQLVKATLLNPAPPNPAAQAQAFRALAELDRSSDPDAARDALLSALRLSPEVPSDLLLTAQIAEAKGDNPTAEQAYRRLLASPAGAAGDLAAEANAGLAELLLQEGKYADAEPLVKAALGHSPDDPALNAQLATALIGEGKRQDAVPVLEKLRRLEPQNPQVQRMLADAFIQAGHPEQADPIYEELLKADPSDQEACAALGRDLLLEKRYPEAEESLAQAVKLKPDDADSWSGLAFAATQTKNYQDALQALAMRAKYLPETPSTYFLWAISYDNLHRIKAAEEYYRKFLAAAGGKFPDQEWQARHRLVALDPPR